MMRSAFVEEEAAVKIPNAENAVIAASKLRDYLLDPTHEWGGSKAKLLISLGYSAADYQRLEVDLRAQHLTVDYSEESDSAYGKSYVIVAPLNTPSGRSVVFRS